MSSYRTAAPFEVRRAEVRRLTMTYPGRLAIVVEQAIKKKGCTEHLLALPGDAAVAESEATATKLLSVAGAKLALAVAGFTPASSTQLEDLHGHCKNADGFLNAVCDFAAALGASAHIPYFATGVVREGVWWWSAATRKMG